MTLWGLGCRSVWRVVRDVGVKELKGGEPPSR